MVCMYVLCMCIYLRALFSCVRRKTGHTHKHITRTTPHNTRQEPTPQTTTRRTTPFTYQRSKVARRRCVPPPTNRWVAAPKSAWGGRVERVYVLGGNVRIKNFHSGDEVKTPGSGSRNHVILITLITLFTTSVPG